MQITGKGIKKNSNIFFFTPTQNAKEHLLYPIAAGDFYCDENYFVERIEYESILALYVFDGSITCENEETITVEKDELILIDCYKPHKYFATNYAHTLWIHFDGKEARSWYDQILLQKGKKIKCSLQIADYILNIINNLNEPSEYDYSRFIYSLLCELCKPDINIKTSEKYNQLEIAKDYIFKNYSEDLTVEQIASQINLSASYFTKLFKEATLFSPYDFLLKIRLEKSKELLCQTTLSISDIAYKSGFKSSANFIYFFKKEMGISPLKFRNLKY